MRFSISRLYLLGLLPTLCLVASADSVSSVYVSLGPTPNSPSYSGTVSYTTNAQTSVENGGIPIGNINLSPTSYNTVTQIQNSDINFDMNFNNWRSQANPNPPFQNEFGTAVYFSIVFKAAPGQNTLTLNDISFVRSSTDPYTYFDYSSNFSGYNYAADKEGILANGTTVANGTSGTTAVNEIVLTDVGVGFDVGGAVPPYAGTPQQQLNEATVDENTSLGNYSIQICFTESDDGLSNCGNVNVGSVPEPATIGLLGLGCVLALPLIRRARRNA